MSEKVAIRLATADDLPFIMNIVYLVVVAMNSAGNFQWHSTYPQEKDFQNDLRNGVLYVATIKNSSSEKELSSGEVVGFAAITTHQPPEYGTVNWGNGFSLAVVPHRLGVSPNHQGRGIAQALMSYVEVVAKNLSISCIRVDTNILNGRMQHIFQKLGYKYLENIFFHKGEHGRLEFKCYQKLI